MSDGTVLPIPRAASDSASAARCLFGRPLGSSYRRAIASCLTALKARTGLSNIEMAEVLGCDEKTIRKALTAENGNLDVITLLNIAYAYGEEAIEPVRALYLCAAREPETRDEKRRRLIRELMSLEDGS
jgi:transcriptional regulator with XRE-family HTH domain